MHGVHIGAQAVIANHCTVLDGAVIGARSLIAAHSLVIGGTKIPDEVVVTGAPAKVRGPIAGTGAEMWVNTNPGAYQDLARRYVAGLRPIPELARRTVGPMSIGQVAGLWRYPVKSLGGERVEHADVGSARSAGRPAVGGPRPRTRRHRIRSATYRCC